jgi:hypothetical protein
MLHRQESASKILHVQGPFGDFPGNCDKLEGLKLTKVGLAGPVLLPWMVP